MSQPYHRERELAIHAVRTAAALCRSVRSRLAPDVLAKADRSPVTVADFGTGTSPIGFIVRNSARRSQGFSSSSSNGSPFSARIMRIARENGDSQK